MIEQLAPIITAFVALITAIGAAARFIWNKVEARFALVEVELGECRAGRAADTDRRAVQLTVIELLWMELKRLQPNNGALSRSSKLLEELKTKTKEGQSA